LTTIPEAVSSHPREADMSKSERSSSTERQETREAQKPGESEKVVPDPTAMEVASTEASYTATKLTPDPETIIVSPEESPDDKRTDEEQAQQQAEEESGDKSGDKSAEEPSQGAVPGPEDRSTRGSTGHSGEGRSSSSH
jgi:hypothetical protein